MTNVLPDHSAFFVGEVDTDPSRPRPHPIYWNPYNKVVHDHRDGSVIQPDTDIERAKRGLPTPWCLEVSEIEVHEPPID